MTITNPKSNSNNEDLNSANILGVNVTLGSDAVNPSGHGNNLTVEQHILGDSSIASFGSSIPGQTYHFAEQKYLTGVPSGYNQDGTPTFGDGKAYSTVWNTDDHDIITYFKPLRPRVTDYDSLPS